MNNEIFNKKHSKSRRQHLRNNSAEPERRIWSKLRNSQFYGYKFRRQHSIGQYIVDFYCPKLKLVIEIDGNSHFDDQAKQYDVQREVFLKSLGIQIVRFNNDEVMNSIEGVFDYLCNWLS